MKRCVLAFALLALVATGCGTQTGAGLSDPAGIAPANSLAFVSFEIAPQGAEKQNFDAAFGKLLGADPEAQLGRAFTTAASTGGKLDYATDVRPWLGDTVSALITHVAPGHCDYAVLAASTDDAKAQAAIDKDLAGRNAKSLSYRDVSYRLLDDGTANGIVAHYLVAGTESAFKAVIDASKDGNSLAASDQWKNSVGDRATGKVGLAYVDVKGMLQSLASGLPGVERVAAPLMLGLLQLHPFVGTLDAQPNALVGDLSSPGTKADPRGPAAAASPLIDSLPADSWLALALPQVGPQLTKIAKALQASPLIGSQYAQVTAKIKAATGLDLQRDVLDTVGDLALFARGTTPMTVGGGLVVDSTQPARLTRSLRHLRSLIHAAPAKRVQIRAAGSRTVAAYGAAAARAGIRSRARLGDTLLFKKAASVIGQRPTLFVDFAGALALGAASPHHKHDAHFQQALPHLRHIEYLAAGARRDAGLDVLRGVVGLR